MSDEHVTPMEHQCNTVHNLLNSDVEICRVSCESLRNAGHGEILCSLALRRLSLCFSEEEKHAKKAQHLMNHIESSIFWLIIHLLIYYVLIIYFYCPPSHPLLRDVAHDSQAVGRLCRTGGACNEKGKGGRERFEGRFEGRRRGLNEKCWKTEEKG